MPGRTEHFQKALELIKHGEEVLVRISILTKDRGNDGRSSPHYPNYDRYTEMLNELEARSANIWAQAQVHATLANVQNGVDG